MEFKIGDFFRNDAFRVFTAIVTGALTYYAGWSLTNQIPYAIALVLLCEGLTLYWPFRLEGAGDVGTKGKRNAPAVIQWLVAIIGIITAWLSVIVTDLACATIIASQANIRVFSAFADIPLWAQEVVVYVLPVLAVTHGILLTVFYVASPEAAHKRTIRAITRKASADMKRAEADAEKARMEKLTAEYRTSAVTAAKELGATQAQEKVAAKYRNGPKNK